MGPTFYVATNGDDTHAGTVDSPWKTIQHAASTVNAGSTVMVRGGTYAEAVNINVSGSPSAGPVTFQAYPGETAVLDGTNLTVPTTDASGLINIVNQAFVTVRGFEIRNYTSNDSNTVPTGIMVRGAGSNIQLLNNHVHHIATTVQTTEGNAHGIAFYGTGAASSLDQVTVDGNEVDHLMLGSSESVVVNGNVEHFSITNNRVHDNNNIGIVAIGYEGTCPNAALDRARDGVIRGNTVTNISSLGNPAYMGSYGADGIYVDGGTRIIIENNTVTAADIGIEVASEHAMPAKADFVTVQGNTISLSNISGISLGGYDSQRGSVENCTISHNTLSGNDASNSGSGELQFQFYVRNNALSYNVFTLGPSDYFYTVASSSAGSGASGNTSDYNTFHLTQGAGIWAWTNGNEYSTLASFQSDTGQDAHSTAQ